MSRFILLFFEFFKIGLFSVGGGMATLPFLYRLADKYTWFNYHMIGDMIAISESTPGPMGVNMATYTGFQYGGVLGSVIATVGLVCPSVIVIIIVSKFLEKFRSSPHVENVFYMLRPAVVGLIAAAGFAVIKTALFDMEGAGGGILSFIGIKECILFIAVFLLTNRFKAHPVFFIAAGAAIGIVFKF